MSVEDCRQKAEKYLKDSGMERKVSAMRLKEMANLLKDAQADTMSPAEFNAKVQTMMEEKIDAYQAKNRADRVANLLWLKNTSDSIGNNIEFIKDKIEKGQGGMFFKDNPLHASVEAVRNFIEGGAIIPGMDSKTDPAVLTKYHQQTLRYIFNRAIAPIEALVESGAVDKESIKALAAMNNKSSMEGLSADAITVAKAWKTIQEALFQKKQSRSVWLEEADERIMRMAHNRERIAAATSTPEGKQQWLNKFYDAAGNLEGKDEAETKQTMLTTLDHILDGTHGTMLDNSSPNKYASGVGTGQSVSRKMGASRTYKMGDPDKFWEYFSNYGPRNIYEAFDTEINQASRQVMQIDKFGTTPRANFEAVLSTVEKDLKGDELQTFKASQDWLRGRFNAVMGTNKTPSSSTMYDVMQGMGSVQYMAKASKGILKAPMGIPFGAKMLDNTFGSGFIKQSAELAMAVAKNFMPFSNKSKVLEALDLQARSQQADMMANFGTPDAQPGAFTKTAAMWGKMIGHNRWQDSMAAGQGMLIAKYLSEMSDKSFLEMTPHQQEGLQSYGIKTHEWDAISSSKENRFGHDIITPSSVRNMSDTAAEIYARKAMGYDGEGEPSREMLYRIKDYLASKVAVLINTHTDSSAMMTNTRQRNFLYGTGDGLSDLGMLRRLALQFHGPAAVQSDVFRQAWASGDTTKGALAGVAKLAAGGLASGVMLTVLRDLADNKTPDLEAKSFALRSLMVGGVPGILADPILNAATTTSYSQMKLRLAAAPLGPGLSDVVSAAGGLMGMGLAKGRGEKEAKEDLMKTVMGTLPSVGTAVASKLPVVGPAVAGAAMLPNTPYLAPIMKLLFHNELREAILPGSNSKEEHGMHMHGQRHLIGD